MPYRAPEADILFALKRAAGLDRAMKAGAFAELGDGLLEAVIGEAGKFATDRIAPLLRVGDRAHTPIVDGRVTMPAGWTETYRAWAEAGWNALSGPEAFGGQDLPTLLSVATFEMWNSGSMAFAIGPTLTIGAVEALFKHGSDALKATYLAKLVSGEWMGTMNLTEPQAGSDLAALKARAERAGDGTYRIFGQKIFITYGDHEMTDNIVHLVLARLPDAPAGTRGISLFVVPKYLVNPDGSLGARNDVVCAGIESKLGINGSPTCTMVYGDGGGAIGWLVGEENKGLACMFTMMNNARLAVGIQGVAVAEAATQHALAYAAERRQARAPGWTGEGMSPIALHPDVRRMLATSKALTAAARAICYSCAMAIDMSRRSEGSEAERWAQRAGIVTPLAKAFSTDVGIDVANLGIQVFGGMGFIEESGAPQFLRDARIAAIYEGTNGIQAIDLVTRKLPLAQGAAVAALIAEWRAAAAATADLPGFGETAQRLAAAIDDLAATVAWFAAPGRDPAEALAGATPFLRLMSLVAGGAWLAGGAAEASTEGDADAGAQVALVRFFAENLLAETAALRDRVVAGAPSTLAAAAFLDA
ncbi:acyl-CoA dehydrogenase [Siculibacillus lacustris]|uniref:3-methylmercaptopropionyl-CoA dehydrogenase n=1 Tax=Siculibacillus lacustris TaxID=1549641 RepID=A0A4V2KSU7_9HYPH|nr:acyl-CoA dehydrogenase [Siculibacillus lacustris]TBW34506.1 acyl-CoA dehydrogenase [Siculibacillus lacustris]